MGKLGLQFWIVAGAWCIETLLLFSILSGSRSRRMDKGFQTVLYESGWPWGALVNYDVRRPARESA